MSPDIAAAEMDSRWRTWQIVGFDGDRRRATLMGRVISVIAIGWAIGLFALLF
jgi:hypothetical protein